MRQRTLRPSFFTNEDLAQLAPLTRIVFSGLWCAADRDGRLEDRPARLKVEILPYDRADMNMILSELHQSGFITRYDVDGARFIQVNAFLEHQHPHPNEPSLQIVAPTALTSAPRKAITGNGMQRRAIANPPGSSGSSLTGSSGSSDPPPTPSAPHNGAALSRSTLLSEFARFWQSWPGEKIGKGKAEEKFLKARRAGITLEDLLGALERMQLRREAKAAKGEFVPEHPHPATWLHQRRWEDGPPTLDSPTGSVPSQAKAEEMLFTYLNLLRLNSPDRYIRKLEEIRPDLRAAWEAKLQTGTEVPCPQN